MTKQEFERITMGGEVLDPDTFELINNDYMMGDESKYDYIERVFGRNIKRSSTIIKAIFLNVLRKPVKKALDMSTLNYDLQTVLSYAQSIRIHAEDDSKVRVSHDCAMITDAVDRILFAIKIFQEAH